MVVVTVGTVAGVVVGCIALVGAWHCGDLSGTGGCHLVCRWMPVGILRHEGLVAVVVAVVVAGTAAVAYP